MKTNKNSHYRQYKQIQERGYLMVEVLVSLVIFTTSMIALVALQLNSFSSSQSSGYRGIATSYANDILEKMRANKDAVLNGTYTSTTGTNNSCRTVNFNTANTVADCSSTAMAQDDLKEFSAEVAANLPQGQAVICLDSSQSQGTPASPNCNNSGSVYVVKIFWKDKTSKDLNKNNGYSQVIVGAQI